MICMSIIQNLNYLQQILITLTLSQIQIRAGIYMQSKRPDHKPKTQIQQLCQNPSNTFIIQNPLILPPLSPAINQQLKILLKSTTLTNFRNGSQSWLQYLSQNRAMKELVIKVKEIKPQQQSKSPTKYSIQLFPVYEKYQFSHLISNRAIQIQGKLNNLTKDSLQTLRSIAKWNYRKNEFSIGSQLNTYRHWNFGLQQKWGKPLDSTYVADCRSFKLKYFINNTGKVTVLTEQYMKDHIYLQLKGYQTRLKRGISEEPLVYTNDIELKKIDIIESGYKIQKMLSNGLTYKGKIGLGTDYYHTWYCSMKANIKKFLALSNRFVLMSQLEVGAIQGKNLIPHEMFSRNQSKWMGQRSRMYANCRFDLAARGVPILQSVGIMPSNYISLWASRSYKNQIKFQAQLGMSFWVPKTYFLVDLSLFRLSGIKGEPRFGLKYEF